MNRMLAELTTQLTNIEHYAKMQSSHHEILFGILGVSFAIGLSLGLYLAVHGELTFESLLLGPECAVAAAGLGFHRILDYVGAINPFNSDHLFSKEFLFLLSLVALSIGAHLIATEFAKLTINFKISLQTIENRPKGPLRVWLRLRYTIGSWSRRTASRIQLLTYLFINLFIGGLPMFLSAAGVLPGMGQG